MANYADRKWREEFYVLAYRLAREGLSDEKISAQLGVGYAVLRRWKGVRPAFAQALADGRSHDQVKAEENLLYNRLPPDVRDLWDRLRGADESERDEPEVVRDKRRVRRVLDVEIATLRKENRQRLFIHALLTSFSMTRAREMTATTSQDVQNWKIEPAFAQMLLEVHLAKQDLVESALMDLVREREPAAVIFASKTLNRKRGYNDKVEVSVSVDGGHSVESLGLSLEEQKFLLAKIREAETKALPAPADVVEAEFTVTGGENA